MTFLGVRRLKAEGASARRIARDLKISRDSVRRLLGAAEPQADHPE